MIFEPGREIPVVHECDLCVIGGSCTGVFAAIRGARLGLSVAVVESKVIFGGMATAAQVNEWHSLLDGVGKRPIIGGLTEEVLDRLRSRNAVLDLEREVRGPYALFNSAELALELDSLVQEHAIRVFLQASCVAGVRDGNKITAAILEDKSGRRAIRARMFIDASGDGDLLRRSGFPAWKNDHLQPVSYQMVVAGVNRIEERTKKAIWPQICHQAADYSYPSENATPWINRIPAPADIRNLYGPRLNGRDASDADQVTEALLESRRCHRALLDMIRSTLDPEVAAVALAHSLGVRETWHARCLQTLTGRDLLEGRQEEGSIAYGSYPVDVHSPEGTLIRYLDGREQGIGRDGKAVWRRWRADSNASPSCYAIPYSSLVPAGAENLLVAGRLLDADREAFGAVRVMVNMNQTGEAAGVAAFLALTTNQPVAKIDVRRLRDLMAEGGSIML